MCHASLAHIVHSLNTVTVVVAKAPLPHVLAYQHRESSNLKATNVLLTYCYVINLAYCLLPPRFGMKQTKLTINVSKRHHVVQKPTL